MTWLVLSSAALALPVQASGCRNVVLTRAARDGFRIVGFGSAFVESRHSRWVFGTIISTRGAVSDAFDFGCSMDFGTTTVRNLEFNRPNRKRIQLN